MYVEKKCNLCTHEQAGTNLCSMGYQNSNFKIGVSLFGCAQKYTEQTAHCALVLPGTAGKGLTANDKFVIVDPDCRAHRSGQLELYFRSICSRVVVVGLCEVGNVVEHLQRTLEEFFKRNVLGAISGRGKSAAGPEQNYDKLGD